MSFVINDQVKKVHPWVEGWSYVAVLVVWEVWEVCWILKGFWLCQCFCWVIDLWYECEVLLFFCEVGCCCLSIFVKSYKFCFWLICRDVVVSDGIDGLISMFWNSFFQEPICFTYVFSCAVVDWEYPVIDCASFLSIWNWIFWMHE